MTLSVTDRENQSKLKAALQAEPEAGKLEGLAAALLGRLLGVTVAVAKSGFQHGGDAGPTGRQGRRLRVECKKYADNTSLSDRELLGEIDHALSRDPALEAWVLVATREVSEQLEQSLNQKGESVGVPVVILDFKAAGQASLAALCAFAPDLVESFFSTEAGALARALQPSALAGIERIRLDLAAWSLGFEALRTRSLAHLEKIWRSPRASTAALGQNAAGGADPRTIHRLAVHSALDCWWSGPAAQDAPAAVVGWDGVGKTWATLDWLVEHRDLLPIVLIVPSSAVAGLTGASETAVKRFLADRLYELTGVRDRDHWLRRLEHLLKRPAAEGPVLIIFFDGLNQEPSIPWLLLLKVFQAEAFEARARIVVGTRTLHYEEKLGALRGLVVPAVLVPVDLYDLAPGGELDQMLAAEQLTRDDLHSDLIELARTPRLFRLVVRFRERLVEAGQVTIHRLLWEYGRDSFGERAGRSFSEDDWRDWLVKTASRYRDGVREFSLRTLGETTSRPDLSEREVYARLSDIVDGQFTARGASGALQLKPTIVTHALGAALLAVFDAVVSPTFESLDTELTQWLDPIAGMDQRAEILRAAVSIWVERGGMPATIGGVLVTSWLQTQNVTDAHRRELAALAPSLPDALLDAIEHSESRTHASARSWAVDALRTIKRPTPAVLAAIVARARRWCSVISRDVRSPEHASSDFEKSRSKGFVTRVGVDASGPFVVLGLRVQLVDWDDGALAATVPSILEGLPLEHVMPVFEAAAIAMAIGRRNEGWSGLKWLSLLNERDPTETTTALRRLSEIVRQRTPEFGVNPMLGARVASLLLWLTGQEEDDTAAHALNPILEHAFDYSRDYLVHPSRSLFALERRHAEDALNDTTLPPLFRVKRTQELWFDPTFEPPQGFVEEIRSAAAHVDVDKLDGHSGLTIEDHTFEELEPALARCAPNGLTDLSRRKMQGYSSRPPDSRYWAAIHATAHFLVAGEAESAAARALRLTGREKTATNELYAASQLVILELKSQSASEQANTVISAALEEFLVDISETLRPLSVDEADALIARVGNGSRLQRRDLLFLLSHGRIAFSDSAWSWLTGMAFGDDEQLRGIAHRALATSDPRRFGRELFTRDWKWSATANHWENYYGTGALIEGTSQLPFDQVAPRLVPWRLLEAARRRGADPFEVRLACTILGSLLGARQIEDPDPGSLLSVDRGKQQRGLFRVSVTPTVSENDSDDPAAALRRALDTEAQLQAHQRAADIAVERIGAARAAGASLYLADIPVEDMEIAVIHAPDLITDWLDGSNEPTSDFRRRVHLAEGAYLSVCEALLKVDAPRGVALWRTLRETLNTQFTGGAGVDELLHIAFRAPDSTAAAELRAQLVDLVNCHSDQGLLNLAIAASFNGKDSWLNSVINADQASPLAWRRKRAVVLRGFTAHNDLPVAGAWPEGEILSGDAELRRKSARYQYTEACAHQWWRTYLAAEDSTQAYAAWVLFLRSADQRAWIWLCEDADAVDSVDPLMQSKMDHFRLNKFRLQRAMEKREEKLDRQFLGRDITDGFGPWRNEPS